MEPTSIPPNLNRMTDRARRGLRVAVRAAREDGRLRVSLPYLVSGVIASGGMAANLAINLKFDLSSLPKVNFAMPGEAGPLLPWDTECLEVFERAAAYVEHWNTIGRCIGTDALLIGALHGRPEVEKLLSVAWHTVYGEWQRLLGWDGNATQGTVSPEPKTGFEEPERHGDASPPGVGPAVV